MPDWGQIFDPSLPLLESFVRGTVIYLALLLLMRLVGQREAGRLGITDVLLVVLSVASPGPGPEGSSEGLDQVATACDARESI